MVTIDDSSEQVKIQSRLGKGINGIADKTLLCVRVLCRMPTCIIGLNLSHGECVQAAALKYSANTNYRCAHSARGSGSQV